MLGRSKTWIIFHSACSAIALGMLAASLVFMPVSLAIKGYLAIGIIFLSSSLVALVKTLHDLDVSRDLVERLERARTDRLWQKYAASC